MARKSIREPVPLDPELFEQVRFFLVFSSTLETEALEYDITKIL
jgi:hypothetical protein